MTRRLFTIVSALSLALGVLTATLWVMSHLMRTIDHGVIPIRDASGSDRCIMVSYCGQLSFTLYSNNAAAIQGPRRNDPAIGQWRKQFPEHRALVWHGFAAFSGPYFGTDSRGIVSMGGFERGFTAPHWFVLLIFALLPAYWLRLARGRWQRETWRRNGLCVTCGYDLRASNERCPECGTAIQPQAFSA